MSDFSDFLKLSQTFPDSFSDFLSFSYFSQAFCLYQCFSSSHGTGSTRKEKIKLVLTWCCCSCSWLSARGHVVRAQMGKHPCLPDGCGWGSWAVEIRQLGSCDVAVGQLERLKCGSWVSWGAAVGQLRPPGPPADGSYMQAHQPHADRQSSCGGRPCHSPMQPHAALRAPSKQLRRVYISNPHVSTSLTSSPIWRVARALTASASASSMGRLRVHVHST